MTTPVSISFQDVSIPEIATATGKMAVLLDPNGSMDACARRVNTLSRGAIKRLSESDAFEKMKTGEGHVLSFPPGVDAEAVLVVKLARRPSVEDARKAGAAMGKFKGQAALTALLGNNAKAADISYGIALRAYGFTPHKTSGDKTEDAAGVNVMVSNAERVTEAAKPMLAVADGVFFTRDLVNEPSNILTTENFAERLLALKDIGVEVEVLEEADMEKLGMGALLGVGQGSRSPSKLVVMQWTGGGDEAPFALVGKGVVFDTGGISIKPAGGMEDMTMDMGGAGVVSGVMRALALREAKANIVGVVGIVENMPDGNAQRPGDVVTSMKGDTIEVINTDAEGRLVLADALWYTADRFKPTGMIDLATLTGAVIVALGHENTGVFSNDDFLCSDFLKAAAAEGEGAWRLPLGQAYDDLLKSRIADMKNIGGRAGGSITAAQFLKRFVAEDTPWIHLDIAGTALLAGDSDFAPKGATGWGVRALNRLIADNYEN